MSVLSTKKNIPKGFILGIGNPILDIAVDVSSDFLVKYGLQPSNAILADTKHSPIYQEIVNGDYDAQYFCGGSTQNSIRVAQWMGASPDATVIIGAIGKDENGKKLASVCLSGGVKPIYYESEDSPTGVCAVLILDHERTMVTRLDAANMYKYSHTLTEKVQEAISQAQIIYSASFFISVPEGPKTLMLIAKHALDNNKFFCLNFAAEFLIQYFSEPLQELLPYVDYLFSNETEALCYGKSKNVGSFFV